MACLIIVVKQSKPAGVGVGGGLTRAKPPLVNATCVSHHLRTLRTAGLASSRREHKIILYTLTELGTRLLDTHLTLIAAHS